MRCSKVPTRVASVYQEEIHKATMTWLPHNNQTYRRLQSCAKYLGTLPLFSNQMHMH